MLNRLLRTGEPFGVIGAAKALGPAAEYGVLALTILLGSVHLVAMVKTALGTFAEHHVPVARLIRQAEFAILHSERSAHLRRTLLEPRLFNRSGSVERSHFPGAGHSHGVKERVLSLMFHLCRAPLAIAKALA